MCDDKLNQLHFLNEKKRSTERTKRFADSLAKQLSINDKLAKQVEENKIKLLLIDLYKLHKEINECKQKLQEYPSIIQDKLDKIEELKLRKENILDEKNKAETAKVQQEKSLREFEMNFNYKSKLNYQMSVAKHDQVEKKLKNALKNVEKYTGLLQSSSKLVETLEKEISKVEEQIQWARAELKKRSANHNITESDVVEYNRLKEMYQMEITKLHVENGTNQKDTANLKHLTDLIAMLKTDLKNEIDFVESTMHSSLSKLDREIRDCEEKLIPLTEEQRDLEKQLEIADQNTAVVKKKFDASKQAIRENFSSLKERETFLNDKEFIDGLKQTYPGVYGRLKSLCKPINKKYFSISISTFLNLFFCFVRYDKAVGKIMHKYLNAIIVDSFETVKLLLKNEKNQFKRTEIYLALDKIKAPNLKEPLRHLKSFPDVKLIYDLINWDIDHIEKAIRFVVGNTLCCSTDEVAQQVAYGLDSNIR